MTTPAAQAAQTTTHAADGKGGDAARTDAKPNADPKGCSADPRGCSAERSAVEQLREALAQLRLTEAKLASEQKRAAKFERLLMANRDAVHSSVEQLPPTDCTSLDAPPQSGQAAAVATTAAATAVAPQSDDAAPVATPAAATAVASAAVVATGAPRWIPARELDGMCDELREKLRIPGVSSIDCVMHPDDERAEREDGCPRDQARWVIQLDVQIQPPWADDAAEQIDRVKRAVPGDVWKVLPKHQLFVGPAGPPVIIRPL